MTIRLKKSFLFVSGVLICFSSIYSNESLQVVSQGNNPSATSTAAKSLVNLNVLIPSTSLTNATINLNEKELLLRLQQQVQQLQIQLEQIRAKQNSTSSVQLRSTLIGSSKFSIYGSKPDICNVNKTVILNCLNSDLNKSIVGNGDSNDIMENVNANNSFVSNLKQEPLSGIFNQRDVIDVAGAPAITIGGQTAFLGSYSGNNSIPIGQISSNLFASTLLGQREKFDDYSIFFGGFLETDAQAWFSSGISRNTLTDSTGRSSTINSSQGGGHNIYLTSANLYFLSNLGHYITAQFDFDTDQTGGFGLGNAFVMFGNLDTSPFFVTAGRNKLSVGSYGGGGIITRSINSFLAPGKVTNVSLNYKNDTINTNIAMFGSDDKRANFSAGFFYANSLTNNLAVGFSTGYVFNIAGASNIMLGQALINTNSTQDNIGVFNIDANLAYTGFGGVWQVQSGWSTTTKTVKFSGNGSGVSTSAETESGVGPDVFAAAWYSAINYSAMLGGKNTNFGASYGQTYNAAAIPMTITTSPINFGLSNSGIQHQLILSAQRAYFDNNVLFGPEYVFQKLYNYEYMNILTLDMSIYI